MNEIINFFPEGEISREHYTLSLLEYCVINNLIDLKKQIYIRNVLDNQFIETANQFTMRASSTIPKRQAELIYNSILYQSDVYLLSLKLDEKAVRILLEQDMLVILNRGKNLILMYCEQCKLIFKKAFEKRLNIQIYEYNYIMYKAFDEFNKNYSARFDAMDICTSIDYPLMYQKSYEMKSTGVVFIKEYYTAIMHENELCSLFDEKDICKVLEGFGHIYNCHYQQLLFNIAEVIFRNCLSALLLNKAFNEINLTKKDIAKLYELYDGYSLEHLNKKIMHCFCSCNIFSDNKSLNLYLKKYLQIFAKELYSHLQEKNLEYYAIAAD